MATYQSLQDALKEILKDDHKVSKYDAEVLKEMIVSDGKVSAEEQHFLEESIRSNRIDEGAKKILASLLLRKEAAL